MGREALGLGICLRVPQATGVKSMIHYLGG